MNESRAITGLDRLPWLADEREAPRRRAGAISRAIGIALVLLAVAALSYWLGTKSWTIFPSQQAAEPGPAIMPLPKAKSVETEPEVLGEPAAEPGSLPEAPVVAPSRGPSAAALPRQERRAARPKTVTKDSAEKEQETRSSGLQDPWPARKVEGAGGRLVQVGAFSSRRQAKRGWNALMRINPSLQRLPALVVPVRSLRDNKVYYRLQMGTTSQAHSTALCQKLRMIGQSCIVLAETVEKQSE